MQLVIFFPSFFIFLFSLFKIVKDDHVLLRKNIKIEQIFDICFLSFITAFIIGKIVSFNNSISLPQAIIGGSIGLLLIVKYKKFPLGRIFDFFSISLLNSLPIGYLISGLLLRGTDRLISFFAASGYLFIMMFFNKSFVPRLMNRSIKDGNISLYFVLLFSLFSILISLYNVIKIHTIYLTAENLALAFLLIFSVILLIKQSGARNLRT